MFTITFKKGNEKLLPVNQFACASHVVFANFQGTNIGYKGTGLVNYTWDYSCSSLAGHTLLIGFLYLKCDWIKLTTHIAYTC